MKPNPDLQKQRPREGTAMRTDLAKTDLGKTNEKPVPRDDEDPLPPRMPRR